MGLTVKKMIDLNNEKRELLTPKNKEYFENMLVYIRSNGFFRDEKATEELLLEMLEHLLEAQKEGKSAEEVFGKTPKELADEINQSLPKEPIKNVLEFCFEILLTFFGWFLIPVGIFTYFFKDKYVEVHIGSILLYAFSLTNFFIISVLFILSMLRNSAFKNEKHKKRKSWILGLILGLLIFSVVIILNMNKSFGPKIEINSYTILGLGCFFLLASYLLRKMREAK